jgi:hypothetical protein
MKRLIKLLRNGRTFGGAIEEALRMLMIDEVTPGEKRREGIAALLNNAMAVDGGRVNQSTADVCEGSGVSFFLPEESSRQFRRVPPL